MRKGIIITLIALMALVCFSANVFAEKVSLESNKIERGAKNVALGWTEVPNSIVNVTKDTNNPFLGLTVGVVKGVFNAFARTTSGAWDVATFPVHSGSDEPAIKTEMVEVPQSNNIK